MSEEESSGCSVGRNLKRRRAASAKDAVVSKHKRSKRGEVSRGVRLVNLSLKLALLLDKQENGSIIIVVCKASPRLLGLTPAFGGVFRIFSLFDSRRSHNHFRPSLTRQSGSGRNFF